MNRKKVIKQLLTIGIYFLIIFSGVSVFASPTIYKTWVGENLEFLQLKKNKGYFADGDYLNNFGVSFKDSTLILVQHFYVAGKIGRQNENYVFKVVLLSKDSLIISPSNDRARSLINHKKSFVFVDKSTIYKSDLTFQKIYFSIVSKNEINPTLKLEVDSTGLIYFLSENNTGYANGLYKGKLNNYELEELIEILKTSELDKFPISLGGGFDAPIYNFKFYFNGKTKSSRGTDIPYFNKPLKSYLLSIYDKIDFEKTDEIYEFGK